MGGDDGFGFSIDGGNTWVIDRWRDQFYSNASYSATLNGTYDLVIEYYENGGDNRISFDMNATLLPVRLVHFSGSLLQNKTVLRWKISPESNPDRFEIEHSNTVQNFQTIARVAPDQDATEFTYLHNNVPQGISYYRLKIHDMDGNYTYSQIISLTNETGKGLNIFPTFVQNNSVSIISRKTMQDVSVVVFDMAGRQVNQQYFRSIAGGQTVTMPLSHSMRPGSYLVELRSGNNINVQKLVIVR